MNPQEIGWLEEHQEIERRLAALLATEEAARRHHERTSANLDEASASVRVQQAALDEHEKLRPEPVDNDPDQTEGADA